MKTINSLIILMLLFITHAIAVDGDELPDIGGKFGNKTIEFFNNSTEWDFEEFDNNKSTQGKGRCKKMRYVWLHGVVEYKSSGSTERVKVRTKTYRGSSKGPCKWAKYNSAEIGVVLMRNETPEIIYDDKVIPKRDQQIINEAIVIPTYKIYQSSVARNTWRAQVIKRTNKDNWIGGHFAKLPDGRLLQTYTGIDGNQKGCKDHPYNWFTRKCQSQGIFW